MDRKIILIMDRKKDLAIFNEQAQVFRKEQGRAKVA